MTPIFYPLDELKDEAPFLQASMVDIDYLGFSPAFMERANKYLVFTGDKHTDYTSVLMLEMLRRNLVRGTSNEISKFNSPCAYRTAP